MFEDPNPNHFAQKRQSRNHRSRTKYHQNINASGSRFPERGYNRFGDSDGGGSSTSTAYSGSVSPSDNCSDSDREQEGHRAMRGMFQKMHFPKEVVAPIPFGGHDGGSLSRFLSDFERYFKQKYDGNDRQCSRLLGDFLTGSARRAYDALGGATGRYQKVKPRLLKWYESERISQRRTAEEAFDCAAMEEGESLTIYALRLERLARVAFPNTKREQHRQLYRKFWKTAPRHFTDVMTASEHSLALAGKKNLQWRDVKRLAEVEDRQTRRVKIESADRPQETQVWFSRTSRMRQSVNCAVDIDQEADCAMTSTPGRRAVRFEGGPEPDGLPRRASWRHRDTERRGRSMSRGPLKDMCNWCGKAGHREERCWLKKGCCVVCGSEGHAKDGCPQINGERLRFRPTCSLCKGDHLGRDCPQHPLN